jgi:hypothetical protein
VYQVFGEGPVTMQLLHKTLSGLTTSLKNCDEASFADTFHDSLVAYKLAVSLLENMK